MFAMKWKVNDAWPCDDEINPTDQLLFNFWQQETGQNIICSLGSYRTENTACTFKDQLINAFGEITLFILEKTIQTFEQTSLEYKWRVGIP